MRPFQFERERPRSRLLASGITLGSVVLFSAGNNHLRYPFRARQRGRPTFGGGSQGLASKRWLPVRGRFCRDCWLAEPRRIRAQGGGWLENNCYRSSCFPAAAFNMLGRCRRRRRRRRRLKLAVAAVLSPLVTVFGRNLDRGHETKTSCSSRRIVGGAVWPSPSPFNCCAE